MRTARRTHPATTSVHHANPVDAAIQPFPPATSSAHYITERGGRSAHGEGLDAAVLHGIRRYPCVPRPGLAGKRPETARAAPSAPNDQPAAADPRTRAVGTGRDGRRRGVSRLLGGERRWLSDDSAPLGGRLRARRGSTRSPPRNPSWPPPRGLRRDGRPRAAPGAGPPAGGRVRSKRSLVRPRPRHGVAAHPGPWPSAVRRTCIVVVRLRSRVSPPGGGPASLSQS